MRIGFCRIIPHSLEYPILPEFATLKTVYILDMTSLSLKRAYCSFTIAFSLLVLLANNIMKKLVLILISVLALPTPLWAEKREGKLGAELVNPGFHEPPDWFKSSFLDLRDDVAESANDKKRIILYFYQDGCPYCAKLLDVNFTQRDIVDKTRRHFDVISLNMWGDREITDMQGESMKEKEFAARLKVMFTPTLLYLDEEGGVVLRVNGYYPPHRFMSALDYVSTRQESVMSFRDYFKHSAPKAATGKLHTQSYFLKAPLRLDSQRTSGRLLMVLFEQKQCPACDELHNDILKRKETMEFINRLDVAQVDMWSHEAVTTPKGEKTTAKHWAAELDIKYTPSAVFFDEQGNEVFRWEAYLKSFHVQSSLDYVTSRTYLKEPSFQRFIEARGDALREKGLEIELMQ